MAIVMNMSSYVVENTSATENEHATEMMRSDMDRSLQLAIQQQNESYANRHMEFPMNMVKVDIEKFLQVMSAYRSL